MLLRQVCAHRNADDEVEHIGIESGWRHKRKDDAMREREAFLAERQVVAIDITAPDLRTGDRLKVRQ